MQLSKSKHQVAHCNGEQPPLPFTHCVMRRVLFHTCRLHLLALILPLFLMGCVSAPVPVRLYPGDALPLSSVARLRIPNVDTWVEQVDDHVVRTVMDGMLGKSEFQLKPGTYKVKAMYSKVHSLSDVDRARTDLVLEGVQAGHVYTLRHQLSADGKMVNLYFYDQGTDYDTRCAVVATLPSIFIHMGTRVPVDCY